ncbi:hydrocephalus-inducing protein homolog [Gastrophryne carolinensis]
MPSSKLQGPLGSLQGPLPSASHSKAPASRNPRLRRHEEAAGPLSPSAFLREMSLSTEQRLANTREMRLPRIVQLLDMSETSHQKFSTLDPDQALFQPFPSEIVFQNFLPCETYEVPLLLRNNDTVPRLVKVVQENSPYFKVISPSDVCHKVAPGMPSTFRIQFTPEENKDYFHEVICITEREKFVVPVRAIGARAVLDFPDELSFQVCPVKYNSQKTLLVRNIGNRQACFQLLTQRPFSVEPGSGALDVGESMQVTLDFLPLEVGDHKEDLSIQYDTGEELRVALYGAAADVNVRLDRNSLTIEKTYLSLTNQRTVTISNRSDIIVHFQWKALATLQEEEAQRQRFCSSLSLEEEEETDRFLEECRADPTLRERLSLLSRTFHNRRKVTEADSMLFSDEDFHIEPVEGDVWPNSSVEVSVLFKPRAAQIYQRTVYCDVTGRECRLPLRLRGEGLGPKLCFSFDQLDIGKVFVGSSHSYEVILTNQGAIDGIFSLAPPTSAVASCFSFTPSEGIILPDGHQAIEIALCCGILGEFQEEFRFSVDGSPDDITLTVRGCVIGPTFHFSAPSLHYGDVPFGFPRTLTCSLNNTSLVPMSFTLRIPGDGTGEPSVACDSYVLEEEEERLPWKMQHRGASRPQEFSLNPSRGSIRSQGILDIEVTLCSNQVKRYELALVVNVDGIGEEVLALPITARCVVPPLLVEDPTVNFSRCFLQHPYERTLRITNPSHLPGCFTILPQDSSSSSRVLFHSPMPRAVVQPHSSLEVPIVVRAQVTGEQCAKAQIAVFGHPEAPLEIFLLCTGEGPVVHVHPAELDFASIPVLTDVTRTLRLSNQSLIPAPFQAMMMRKRSVWRVEPSSGEVPAEGDIDITLVAHLDDTVAFKDTVQLVITNSNTYLIPVQALGIGTTIVTDRTFAPTLNLGAHFSAGPCRYHFTMTNRGRRTHQLYWMTEGFPQFRKRHPLPGPKPAAPQSESPEPVFRLRPSRMELHPGQSVDVVLEGSSDVPKLVKERLLGHAIIGKQSGKERIMAVDVTCDFIAPVLHLSARKLHFYVEKPPGEELKEKHETVTLKNISSLPLSIFLSVSPPFSVCPQTGDVQGPLHLQTGEEKELTIRFDPTFITDLQSRVLEDSVSISYAEHPHTDHIALQAEVHFPNLHIPTTQINFGCILNDTESTRELEVTNCSPLPVLYRWSFSSDNWGSRVRQDDPCADQDHPALALLQEEIDAGSHDGSAEDCLLAGVEEVFDILPQFGALQPGESHVVSFTFYGHSDISAEVRALCEVHGGPMYELTLQGEASLVSYTLSSRDIDFGVQMFEQVVEADIVLRNTGRVSFPFTVLTQNPETLHPLPGEPFIEPMRGSVAAGGEETLKISYFPGVPEPFQRLIQLQVAHLEPESIILRGEGAFPRILLDLPRTIHGNERFEPYLQMVAEKIQDGEARPDLEECDISADALLQMELERLLIREHAGELLEAGLDGGSGGTQKDRRRLLRADLPEYLLDFGHVILGEVRSHIIKITNTGHFPASFRADRRGLSGTGFSVELDRVRNLPLCHAETFQVKFDPQSAGADVGPVDVSMPIQVYGGPRLVLRLRASVTVPSLCVSHERLEFSAVQCGQCEIRSVQLYNQLPVPCEWMAVSPEAEAKIDKHIPLHLRKKLRQETKPKPAIFEVIPSRDMLLPGQRRNIEVKFLPQEEKLYSQRLVLQVAQSSQRVMLLVQGQGLEPRLEFTPSVLELGPVLPLSQGDDMEVVVRNPCDFPIEFYSLEMDQQYLEEEKILRMLKVYDSQDTLLLPPRIPGEKLPREILDFYEEQKQHLPEQDESGIKQQDEAGPMEQIADDQLSDTGDKQEVPAPAHAPSHSSRVEGKTEDAEEGSEKKVAPGVGPQKAVGELELNPVSQAIARHMGIDTSSEGQAARNRRGIGIIVHGAPLTGKTSTALELAQHYNVVCLSLDSVVLEAVSHGNSKAGLRARHLCARAAIHQSLTQYEEAAGQAAEASSGQPALSMEAVAKHTAEGGQGAEVKAAVPQSVISRANRTSVLGKVKTESHPAPSMKPLSDTIGSQAGSSPLPPPLQRRLSVSASVAGEQGLMSCVLPDDLLLEILSDRLQLNDCFGGVIFDGLDTLFAPNLPSALRVVLRALNNRRHIYFINLQQDYAAMKACELAKQQQQEEEELRAQAQERTNMEEMDEDEYERLPDEERARVDGLRLQALRERRKRELENRLAREEQERKLQEQLLKQKEEEELRRKSKRGKSRDSLKEDKDGKKSQVGNKQAASKLEQRLDSAMERKVSLIRSDSVACEPEELRKKRSKDGAQHVTVQEDPNKDSLSDGDKQLLQRFKNYESSQKEIAHIVAAWDRVQGIVLPLEAEDGPPEGEEQALERQAPSGKKLRRERERQEKMEKERQEKERIEKLKSMEEEPGPQLGSEQDGQEIKEEELKVLKIEVGIPHCDLQVTSDHEQSTQKILQGGMLPPLEEILEGLGLGPSGPPVPPPFIFSVVPLPEKRAPPCDQETLNYFSFIAASPDDPNVLVEEKKELETEPALTIPALKEEQTTPTKGRSRKEKGGDTGRESQKDKRRSSSVRKTQPNLESRSPPPGARTPVSDIDHSSLTGELEKVQRLGIFRWVVPAGGQVLLRIHFESKHVGNFDQTLNFELVGTRRRYQLYCRGACFFPAISRDPKIVFPHRKREARSDEIVQKKFLLSSGTFHFGPLLCGKSREKYKAGQYPENMEKLIIYNNSPLESDVSFCFQHDLKAATFILDPPAMTLRPNQKQELSIWAYPTSPGVFEDNIVCCIKDNPEPAVFRLSCRGVRPELELDRKQVHFEKILLHRKETRTIYLRNSTYLPAAWQLTGLENLGGDFSVSQDRGIVAPRSEFGLQLHFRAAKATNVKKVVRLEVSDVENILGIVQLENIQVLAEAYDVAMEITFPKGADGGLDFGIVKVMEEVKHSLSLKNKGKYEVGFSFSLEAPPPNTPDLSSIFSILPQKGTLGPSDRPTQVQIIFQARTEVQITDRPILKCQIIEPSLGEGGETIASIPIRASVCSAFSKYRLTPASDINFGAMVLGSRKMCSFTLENCGPLEMRYSISKMIREVMIQPAKKGVAHGSKRSRSREGSESSKSISLNKSKRADSQLRESSIPGQARLALGMFAVSPGFGSIPPGGQQLVNVECFADQLRKSEEFLAIDVSDRNPEEHPNGMPFRLVAEVCTPGFVTDDIGSIFEEHRIVSDARALHCLPPLPPGGIYVKNDNHFLFWNVVIGQTCCAHFKIVNSGKVPCDVALTVKPLSSKPTGRISDVFEVQPSRVSVPSHSHSFVSISFSPQSMQTYQCVFEAAAEGVASSLSRPRSLTFEISGEGNLPRVTVLRPALRNKHGNPLLLFQRLLIGQSQQLPLVLKNEGSIPAQLNIDLPEGEQVFSIKPRPNTQCVYPAWSESAQQGRRPHIASLILHPGDTTEFDVTFCPTEAMRCDCALQLSVLDNQYERSVVQLVGEGYLEELTLDNIHSPAGGAPAEEGQLDDEVLEATRAEHVVFGDCHVGKQYQVTFTMTNRSLTDAMRFEWPQETPLTFSPKVGHIHAGCAKDITLTMTSDVAVTLRKSPVRCRLWRISFPLPPDQVSDWDDRMRTVKWLEDGPGGQRPTKKKVIETDPEPLHTLLDDGTRQVELLVSAVVDYAHAVVDYAQYKADSDDIHFRDTLLYQARVYRFLLQNTGAVQLQFSWQVQMEGRSRAAANEPPRSARSSLTHSRPSSAMESVSSFLSVGTEAAPFSIQPISGTVPAGEMQELLIKFSPVEVGEFEGHLTCSISNLLPGQPEPRLLVRGRSLLPFCHFQLEDSDYISSGRRNPELCGPRGAPSGTTLDPNTRVVEFICVGVRSRNVRSFSIVNPTSKAYTFLWTCEDPLCPQRPPAFRCLTERGVIQPEKKVEITFEFIPDVLDISESFWSFTILEQNICVPFLLVGNALEPSVSLDRSHLNFRSLLIGQEVQESVHLISSEDAPLRFTIREESCFSEGHSQRLSVTPLEGAIPPRGRVALLARFRPSQVGEVNFNLVCDVKTKTEPLSLNVKAHAHATEACVQCRDPAGTTTDLSTQQPNDLDLGQVDVNGSSALQLSIINNGRFSFSFTSTLTSPRSLQGYFNLMPSHGCVAPGDKAALSLTFNPTRRCVISDTQLVIKIEGGVEVVCQIRGCAVQPGVHFSFTEHDFGHCFIYRDGMRPVHKSLLITNKDERDVSLDCLYSNTSHMVAQFSADVLPPGGAIEVPVTFYPRAAVLYQEELVFQMNGHSRQSVIFRGRGVEMKVEVADPRHKVTSFGAVAIGQTIKKIVPIVNRSAAPVTCTFSLSASSPALQDPKVLSLSPSSEVTIPASGGLCHLEMIFCPRSRMAPFSEEVVMESGAATRSLLVVRGSSQGLELSLDQDYVAFGAVVLQSRATRRIVLSNTGELGARFQWDTRKFQPDFSISPATGYITAGSDVTFDVTFHPRQLSSDLHYENLTCTIEGGKTVTLTLSGSCVGLPPSKEVVSFQCPVRGQQTQSVLLSNKSGQTWHLQPIIEGEHWRGGELITVEAHQQKAYDITYQPLVMTSEGKKHQGSVFFPLPDGTGLMFLLQGTADPPKSSGTIVREVPCRTPYTELLPLTNWLPKCQRFRVVLETLKPERLDGAISIRGLDYLEVPGAAKRDYKLSFHSHREGTFSTKVTFRNDITQEYLYYYVTFKCTAPGVTRTIELVTPVRQSTSATVTADNPLATPITFTTDCRVPEINLPPQITVPAMSEGTLMFEYQPLKAGESTGRLTLQSADLGSYQYDLLLKATPAVSEKPLYFRAPLGSAQTLTAKFLNYTRQKAEYSCKVDHADFHVDKAVMAAPGSQGGSEVSIEVTYEPVQLGESRAMLLISSPLGGDYSFPLFGSALAPKPQGPIQIRAGASVSIPFKNVFLQPTSFSFLTDPPAFSTKPGETVRPKKTHHISVSYEAPPGGSRAPVTGRLVVSCPRATGVAQGISWVYYLKGVASEK